MWILENLHYINENNCQSHQLDCVLRGFKNARALRALWNCAYANRAIKHFIFAVGLLRIEDKSPDPNIMLYSFSSVILNKYISQSSCPHVFKKGISFSFPWTKIVLVYLILLILRKLQKNHIFSTTNRGFGVCPATD